MTKKSFFSSFQAEEVNTEVQFLPVGDCVVRIHAVHQVTDRVAKLNTGELKTDVPEWKDLLPQLALVQVGHGPNEGQGVVTNRLNPFGFKRMEEIAADKQKDYFSAGDAGYAVQTKSGKRVLDTVRTEACKRIINQWISAAGATDEWNAAIEAGTNPGDALVGKVLMVTIYTEEYNGKTQHKAKNPRAVPVEAEVTAEADKDNY